ALAHQVLGLLALHELADLAADHVYGFQQELLRFAGLAAREAEHADRFSLRYDRKDERAVHTDSARWARPRRARRRARVLADIGGPERLSRLPRHARQPDALAVGE